MEIKDNYTNKCYNTEWGKTITQINVTTQNGVSAIREAETKNARWIFMSSNDRTPILLNSPSLHSSIHLFIKKKKTHYLHNAKKNGYSEKQKRQRSSPSEIFLLMEEIAWNNYMRREIINIPIIIITDIYAVLTVHQWAKCLTCIILIILTATLWCRKALNWSWYGPWHQTAWIGILTLSLVSYVILGKWLNLSVSQLSYL